MDISIIIVSWNAKEILLECMKSLIDETDKLHVEIIVVDNASTDGSPEAIKESFPQVYLIQNKENLGFAKANNIGIRHSSGRYICLMNSDVKVLKGCFNKLLDFLDQHPTVGMVGPKEYWPDMTLQS